MNANIPNKLRLRGWIGRRRCQWGGETVEFALLAGLFFLLLFGIIEFSIAMYNQGILLHSSRVGAREASLYWLDVTQISLDSDPEDDQRVKISEVDDAITNFAGRFMISFTDATTAVAILHEGQRIDSMDTRPVGAGERVRVDLSFLYRAPVTAALAGLLDMDMAARAEMRVE
ncbi:TadE/TadG family type IV pilus assembly protein [Thiocystis violacea]|uniref:TadE/TadG family type IV pilus assembly protein n=1 Tax=Thiocystis violacea TaxID=13725 RepID=UPI0019065176|nr:TadE/TadG family type IV pilus assembly protein [Thiocystis violacea]MBK1719250.1 hypothetical protein [Thiocystis violacea]